MSDSLHCPHCNQMVVVDKANKIPPLYYVCSTDEKWNHLAVFHAGGCPQSYLRIFEVQASDIATELRIERRCFGTPNSTIKLARASWEASGKLRFADSSVSVLAKELAEMPPIDFALDPAFATIFADVQRENGTK